MAKQVVGGADSFWVRFIATLNARHITDPAQVKAYQKDFWEMFLTAPEASAEVNRRHAKIILNRMFGFLVKTDEVPAPKSPDLHPVFPTQAERGVVGAGLTPEASVADFQKKAAEAKLAEVNLDDVFNDSDVSIDDILEGIAMPSSENPMLKKDGPFYAVIARWATERKLPLIDVVTFQDKRYVVVGTCTAESSRKGRTININCASGNVRKIKDAGLDLLVHHNDRPLCITFESPTGEFYTLYIVNLNDETYGKTIRFWLNVNEGGKNRGDDPRGNFRFKLTAAGYDRIR